LLLLTYFFLAVVDAVRDYTPNGGFVKQDHNGQWYDVGDALAREKIGQWYVNTGSRVSSLIAFSYSRYCSPISLLLVLSLDNSIRDQLHSKYKSSTKAKKQRRKAMEQNQNKDDPSKTTGRITPIKSASSSYQPLSSFDPFSNEEEHRSGMAPLVEESDKEEDDRKEGGALALMLAPIGESFVTGDIEVL
jgi:hypothetical protein